MTIRKAFELNTILDIAELAQFKSTISRLSFRSRVNQDRARELRENYRARGECPVALLFSRNGKREGSGDKNADRERELIDDRDLQQVLCHGRRTGAN